MAEIFKQYINNEYPDNYVTEKEWEVIKETVGNDYRTYDDKANDLYAIAIPLNDDNADNLVQRLNELCENEDEWCWYLGDTEEEYVFID